MKLWRISQNINNDYDTFSDAIVAAETEEEARNTHPGYGCLDTWCSPEHVKVELIGEAAEGIEAGVICASFNAG